MGVPARGTGMPRVNLLTRRPFRRRHRVRSPAGTANESPQPSREHRRTSVRFYLGHTPSLWRLNHPADHSRAPVATPAATDLPALAVIVSEQVTSLSVLPEGSWPYVPGFRPGIVSMSNVLMISGGRTWKHPLTHRSQVFAVGHVSCSNHWQALAGLSWLSSSSLPHFSAVAGLVRPGPSRRRARNSPRQPG
jgi:hypothetical protein